MAAILQITKSPDLNEKSYDSDEIWYTKADLKLGDSHVTKCKILKIKDGERSPF